MRSAVVESCVSSQSIAWPLAPLRSAADAAPTRETSSGAEDGGLFAAVGAPDVVAQDRAAVGGRSGEHDAEAVDDAALGQLGGVGRHILPARAGDEVDTGRRGANGLSHVRVKYPVVREEHNYCATTRDEEQKMPQDES